MIDKSIVQPYYDQVLNYSKEKLELGFLIAMGDMAKFGTSSADDARVGIYMASIILGLFTQEIGKINDEEWAFIDKATQGKLSKELVCSSAKKCLEGDKLESALKVLKTDEDVKSSIIQIILCFIAYFAPITEARDQMFRTIIS